MITVSEIKSKAERMYFQVLRSYLENESFFPKTIRSDKSFSKEFVQMSREIRHIIAGSKDRTGYGYKVISTKVKTKLHGVQDIPAEIVFETLEDYLKFTGKQNEYEQFIHSSKLILEKYPRLKNLFIRKPDLITENSAIWDELLRVCKWFSYDFQPDCYYIRELPIAVHTKFIEENKVILRLLLDELIPEKLNREESVFEKRFYLKYALPVIRFRLESGILPYTDLSIPLDQFILKPIKCKKIFIIENLINFLTFPVPENSLIVWGKGFAIECLKSVRWFENKEINYWSDLDVQGFQMLSQLRSYFPDTKSLLMDIKILNEYRQFCVPGTKSSINNLDNLTIEEREVFYVLKENNIRLEQERISQDVVVKTLNDLQLEKKTD